MKVSTLLTWLSLAAATLALPLAPGMYIYIWMHTRSRKSRNIANYMQSFKARYFVPGQAGHLVSG
jgi:hypothetical protein